MGFNDLMHPRNIYRNSPPDFQKLAFKFEYFRKFTKETNSGRLTVNFKDPEALRALTCALLEHDFGLKVSIPVDRLIPTVPLRLNYILWIEDLLKSLSENQSRPVVRGFDIGTGASCIYPLLGAKLTGWTFLATEVDESSLSYALENVRQNNLEGLIRVKKVASTCFLWMPLKDEEKKEFDFCMCNPPFFVNEFEASHGVARSEKRPQPSGVCTGTGTETVTGGGEVEFVKGIIKDSITLKNSFRWYTTMLGKKSSMVAVLSFLKDNNIHTVATTEFCQGRTMRWGVAWTFLPDVAVEESPSKRRKRAKKSKPLRLLVPDQFTGSLTDSTNEEVVSKVSSFVSYIKKILTDLQVKWTEERVTKNLLDQSGVSFVLHCHAEEKSWANQRRKRRENARKSSAMENTQEKSDNSETDKKDNIQSVSLVSGVSELGSNQNDKNAAAISEFRGDYSKPRWSSPQASIQSEDSRKPLLSFQMLIGVDLQKSTEDSITDSVVLEMEWIGGEEKNDLYQLFQFFQNKILKGL